MATRGISSPRPFHAPSLLLPATANALPAHDADSGVRGMRSVGEGGMSLAGEGKKKGPTLSGLGCVAIRSRARTHI